MEMPRNVSEINIPPSLVTIRVRPSWGGGEIVGWMRGGMLMTAVGSPGRHCPVRILAPTEHDPHGDWRRVAERRIRQLGYFVSVDG